MAGPRKRKNFGEYLNEAGGVVDVILSQDDQEDGMATTDAHFYGWGSVVLTNKWADRADPNQSHMEMVVLDEAEMDKLVEAWQARKKE